MTRNEDDILEEVMTHNKKFFDKILVVDGSTDKSEEIIRSFDNVVYFLKDHDVFPKRRAWDGIRQFILEKAQELYGTEGWFTLLHGDEIFVDDPNQIALRAENVGADKVNWHSLDFFLHTSQKDQAFDSKESIQKQFLYYQPGSLEIRQFRNKQGIFYNLNQRSNVVPYGIGWKILFDFPLFKHYVSRTPQQMEKKYRDQTRMSNYDGSFVYEDCFRERYSPSLKQIRKYDGSFHEFEPGKRPPFFFQWLSWRRYWK